MNKLLNTQFDEIFIKIKKPNIKGFGDKNLWRIKQFYETYGDNEKLASLGRVLSLAGRKGGG